MSTMNTRNISRAIKHKISTNSIATTRDPASTKTANCRLGSNDNPCSIRSSVGSRNRMHLAWCGSLRRA